MAPNTTREDVLAQRIKEIAADGFTPIVCDQCSGGVRYSTNSVCQTCKGTGMVASKYPAPIAPGETQRSRSPTSRLCPLCGSPCVMADGELRGVCNACGHAWDERPYEASFCVCGHRQYAHDADGEACGVFINESLGDCPCESFRLS